FAYVAVANGRSPGSVGSRKGGQVLKQDTKDIICRRVQAKKNRPGANESDGPVGLAREERLRFYS
ncbi:MAG: hypothetical protein M0T76_09100, partial [Desulfobacteraceae bacterium]|nr:hypothetical protein [Desulfobacteraceae bacterium]